MAGADTHRLDAGASPAVELQDLLELERDAIRAYSAALERLQRTDFRAAVEWFVEQHERHADELTRLARAYGAGRGRDAPPGGEGPLERAVRAARVQAGDRGVVAALKRCERAGRDRFRRALDRGGSPEVVAVLRRAASDEAAHYAWALEALDDLDAAAIVGGIRRLMRAIGNGLDRTARLVVSRGAAAGQGAAQALRIEIGAHPVRLALVAVAVGAIAAGAGHLGGHTGDPV